MGSPIEDFAEQQLGIKLFPAQLKMIEAFAENKTILLARAAGKSTVDKVIREYLKAALLPKEPPQ